MNQQNSNHTANHNEPKTQMRKAVAKHFPMKKVLILMVAGLMTLNSFAAEAPDQPLQILYLGTVDVVGEGGGRGGSRTNYVYLPGQTLAPEAIYFDHLTDLTHLTEKYLKHFDAVVQVLPDAQISADHQKLLDGFKSGGNPVLKYPERPTDAVLREAVLGGVSRKAKTAWEVFLAARPPLQRLPGEVPNYERRPEPVKYQAPLSARDSMRYTQVPADFELQLFAAEPDVVKPICMAWDERGRAWVVEAQDYPHGLVNEGEPGESFIKICEDTDGDGKADKFTVFAAGLNLASALVFVNDGVIVAEARRMLYLKDTNGDDKADVREVLLPGWGIGDTHAMQSNLGRGFDNWLYGAVGYSNFRGTVGGKELQFGQGVYRFKADGSALEFLHQFNNNTWGFGLNEHGDVFGSTANNHPSFYGYLPAHILNPTQPGAGAAVFGAIDRMVKAGRMPKSGASRPRVRWRRECGCIRTRRTCAWWTGLVATRPPRDMRSWSAMRCPAAARQSVGDGADGQAHRHHGYSA
jgi:hypothetical protein